MLRLHRPELFKFEINLRDAQSFSICAKPLCIAKFYILR
ncbi:hypothetical protein CAMGR0001_2209 [Campylobacter gracilis RM3268]|uniref:Uncharacterized protein n=1 Tax=Campylobacter gracilis RM3268 TaxID=553220 RepID=C8PH21_9BACT|nr:hypothetical protein CAMGR0001_2209 [Campylobacter gracilis RM3268]